MARRLGLPERLAVVLVLTLALVGCGHPPVPAPPTSSDTDAQQVGTIDKIWYPEVTVGRTTAAPGTTIRSGDNIAANGSGGASFSLPPKIRECRLFHDADLTVLPSPGVLLRFNANTIGCQTSATPGPLKTTALDLNITMNDPIWTVDVKGPTVTIKVGDGFVTVTRPDTPQPTVIMAGFQARITTGVPIDGPTKFFRDGLSPDERTFFDEHSLTIPVAPPR